MKLNTFRSLVGITLLSSSFVTAQAADTGFYVGGGLGMSYGSNVEDGIPNKLHKNVDDKDFAWKLLGGYQFNPMFGLEAFYVDFGKFKANGAIDTGLANLDLSIESKNSALGLAATAAWPINQQFSFFGKAGLMYVKSTSNTSGVITANGKDIDANQSNSGDTNNINFMAGAGVEWVFPNNPELSLRAEWEFFNDVGKDNAKAQPGTDIHLFSASLVYSF